MNKPHSGGHGHRPTGPTGDPWQRNRHDPDTGAVHPDVETRPDGDEPQDGPVPEVHEELLEAEPAGGDTETVAALQQQVETLTQQHDQLKDQLLRIRAEADNIQRRSAQEIDKARKFALEGFVRELLQVRDSLELGNAAAQEPGANVDKLREGTELTLRLLTKVMEKFGVKEIDPLGALFDPELHQAISMHPATDEAPNTVSQVVQKGYLLNDRLVRPAMVIVAQ